MKACGRTGAVANRLRIIGGAWRSRVLRFPDAEGLRPTPDRVRETLFNWLGQRLSGLDCVDLFAGSGALGFEARSRGAARVTLVERDRKVAGQLRLSATALGDGGIEVVNDDAMAWLRRGPKARTTKAKARVEATERVVGELTAAPRFSTQAPPSMTVTNVSNSFVVNKGCSSSSLSSGSVAPIESSMTLHEESGPSRNSKSAMPKYVSPM